MSRSPLTWSRQRRVRGWLLILEITVGLCSRILMPSLRAQVNRTNALGTLSAELRVSPPSHCSNR